MSLVEIRVELPAYSYFFVVLVTPSSTILDVKQEISKTCVGAPQVEGQRIIWRGRLLRDHERVDELWKTPEEPRTVHLAVHPSAWSSYPPEIPQPTATNPTFYPAQPQVPASAPSPYIPFAHAPHIPPGFPRQPSNLQFAFIKFQHQNAINVLTQGRTLPVPDQEASRAGALQLVERNGFSWPTILDEEYPGPSPGGLIYDRVQVGAQSYLKLRNPDAYPTAIQTHALKVLTYTFPLLSLPSHQPALPQLIPSHQVIIPPHVNAVLQQLGLPQIRVAPNPNANRNGILPQLREMPVRQLMIPLIMLAIRTILLLYFVAPARKPVFGILILAWMLYEGWQAVRDGMLGGLRRANRGHQRQPQQAAGPGLNPPPPVNQDIPQPQRQQAGPPGNGLDNQARALLDNLGNINLQSEEAALRPGPGALPVEPGLVHKAITFLTLLVVTIHPAVWNQRRVALRRREGTLRTEANARELQTSPEGQDDTAQDERQGQVHGDLLAQHARRPRWVQTYVERVRSGDWVDDSD